MGCGQREFWYGDPQLLWAYVKAHRMKLQDETRARREELNLTAWLTGVYAQAAVASVFSKNARYPQKPYDLFSEEEERPLTQEEAVRRNEEAIKAQTMRICAMFERQEQAGEPEAFGQAPGAVPRDGTQPGPDQPPDAPDWQREQGTQN